MFFPTGLESVITDRGAVNFVQRDCKPLLQMILRWLFLEMEEGSLEEFDADLIGELCYTTHKTVFR